MADAERKYRLWHGLLKDFLLKTSPPHLQLVFGSADDDLRPEQRKSLKDFLLKNRHNSAKDKNDLGRTKLVHHKIDTGTSRPIKQNPRSFPLAKREAADKEVDRMLGARNNQRV